MSKAKKQGLRYFSLDVEFFTDDKISLIQIEFGNIGVMVIIRLLCKIFKEGYFYNWNRDTCKLFCHYAGREFEQEMVDKIVRDLVDRGYFDKPLFEKYGILTSLEIQLEYIEATKRYKEVEMLTDYILIDLSNSPTVKTTQDNPQPPIVQEDTQEESPKDTQKESPKEDIPKRVGESKQTYHFVDPEFKETFDTWLEYKGSRKEKYKTEMSLKACYDKLIRISNKDPSVAKEIIAESMANNYAGFFPITNKKNPIDRNANGVLPSNHFFDKTIQL